MNEVDQIKKQLLEFRICDKFEAYGYLQPAVENSIEADKKNINEEMNACTDELLKYLELAKPKEAKLKKIVRSSLERIVDLGIDTEDREFCYELYFKVGEILGVDIEDKNKTLEQKMMEELQRAMKKTGMNQEDLQQLLKNAGMDPNSLPK